MWRQPPIWEPLGDEVPAVQHHDAGLLLYRKAFRSVCLAGIIDCR
jgi:hypothetical protein